MKIGAYGERAVEIVLDDDEARAARAVARSIEAAKLRGVVECVPGYGAVLVHLERGASIDLEAIRARAIDPAPENAPNAAVHVVPAVYDGVDLEEVARACRLDVAEVIHRHAAASYEVEVIGFLPGFAYLGDVDASMRVPRWSTPRTRVAAGSIAVAGSKTAIYPLDSPGGWRIVGRAVGFAPFDPTRTPPCAFSPGNHVRFAPIDPPSTSARAQTATTRDDAGRSPALVVEKIGPGATIQDRGRLGHARAGVPAGGPLDAIAFEAATSVVEASEAIELPLSSARFRARGELVVSLDGAVARTLRDGESIDVERDARAVRYLAVRGGIDVPIVLGARGTLVVAKLGGLDGRMLRAGDVIGVAQRVGRTDGAEKPRGDDVDGHAPPSREADGDRLACMPTVDGEARLLDALLAREWRIDPRSDRVGTRLDGDPIPPTNSRPIPSRPTTRGAVQLPPDGRPIVLGPDAPTTGGYPVIAVLSAAACSALARLRPGERVRFSRA